MSNEKVEYNCDERIPCKYGSHCYQKNKAHQEKYKHPSRGPPNEVKGDISSEEKLTKNSRSLKQQKLNLFFLKKNEDVNIGGEAEQKVPDVKKVLRVQEEHEEEMKVQENLFPSMSHVSEEQAKTIIKKLFLVEMPEDFYSFWKYCKMLSPQNPRDALNSIDLTLVGPFDVLAGTLKDDVDEAESLTHWRYYYDPPEFQTILKGKDSFHLGYFRDDPNSLPVFVACNTADKNSLINHVAENIFGAVDWCLNQSEKLANPFKKVKSSHLRSSLHEWAKKYSFTLDKYSKSMQERNKLIVSKTFHQGGIVVPYDKNTQLGYRPLSETTENLKKLLQKIEHSKTAEERTAHLNSLHSVVNWANIAMDEGDFGTNLELGLNLFSYGTNHFDSIIRSSLRNAYNFLGRQAFAKIIEVHLNKRKRVDDLGITQRKMRN